MNSCFKPAQFCFRLGCWAALAALSLAAAEPAPETQRIRSVVKADARTGKLVRSVIVSPKPAATTIRPQAAAPVPAPLDATVEKIAAQRSLPPELLRSVIKVESNFNRFAISPKGASGLMQLIPATAARFGVSDVFDPEENIQAGARYLKYLLNLYSGDYPRALAAYNAGEGAVAKYKGVPPYPETQNYVVQVQKRFDEANIASAAKQKDREIKAAAAKPEGPSHIQEVLEPDGTVRYIAR